MSWEAATFGMTALVLVMQGISLYTQAKIKLWALEKFVTKDDFHAVVSEGRHHG